MNDYPMMIAPVNHVEPVPRRIRAFLAGEKVLDTTRALYAWEWLYYPQYYIPSRACGLTFLSRAQPAELRRVPSPSDACRRVQRSLPTAMDRVGKRSDTRLLPEPRRRAFPSPSGKTGRRDGHLPVGPTCHLEAR